MSEKKPSPIQLTPADKIKVGFLAIGGRDFKADDCQCDSWVGYRCEYCAIHAALVVGELFQKQCAEKDRAMQNLIDAQTNLESVDPDNVAPSDPYFQSARAQLVKAWDDLHSALSFGNKTPETPPKTP